MQGHRLTLAVVAVVSFLALACSTSDDNAGSQSEANESTQAASNGSLGAVVNVSNVAAGEQALDVLGNSITIHGWAQWPSTYDVADPFAAQANVLFGSVGVGRAAGTSVAALDVEVCTSADQPQDLAAFGARFALVDDSDVEPGAIDPRAVMIFDPVRQPAFAWPAAASCTRGWQGITVPAGGGQPVLVEYTAVTMTEAAFGERHVYRFALDAEPTAGGPATLRLDAEATGAFENEWSASLLGWREVGDLSQVRTPSNRFYATPPEGFRMVATLWEICAGDAGLGPDLGLQVDGWDLARRDPAVGELGPGYAALGQPGAGDCATGWAGFAIPDGATPTGAFAVDRAAGAEQVLEWALPLDELPAPDIGFGFPNELLVSSVQSLCGVESAMDVVSAGGPISGAFRPSSAVAVFESPDRVAVLLSEQTLTPEDLPDPMTDGLVAVSIVVADPGGAALEPGRFRIDLADDAGFGQALVVQAGSDSRWLAVDAEVEITEITDEVVCGEVSTGAGPNQINGVFAAPVWRP